MSRVKYGFHDVQVPESLLNHELLKGINPLVLKIAYKNGFQSAESITQYLFGSGLQNEKFMMTDTDKAVVILKDAVKNKKRIIVYQDYDVDGCCAGAVCLECIRNIGGVIESYVNARELDGYGICKNGIDKIGELYPDTQVILTVDNGIVAHNAIAYAKSKGYKVIVTDHHLPGCNLPNADAVIDPKRTDEVYPFHELCGTAVAYKLMLALYYYMGKDNTPVKNTLDMVALATVADIVPLVEENRELVREGLKMMNAGHRSAINVMRNITNQKDVTSYTIGFIFGPMINALSRMGEDSHLATEALISNDTSFLEEKIKFLQKTNEDRKGETDHECEIAMGMIDPLNMGSSIVLYSEQFQEGIIGIVAGRLKNEFHRPVVVFAKTEDPEVLKASCRSIDEFPLKEKLDEIADTMIGYGGHAKAAGLSIHLSELENFRKKFTEMTDKIPEDAFVEHVELADVLSVEDVTVNNIVDLRLLEPHGEGNKVPLFGLKYTYDDVRFMGSEQQHVKYWNSQHNVSIIEWGGGEKERMRQAHNKIRSKVVGKMNLNVYNNRVYPQFICSN